MARRSTSERFGAERCTRNGPKKTAPPFLTSTDPILRGLDPVRVVLVEGVAATDTGPLDVELLGEDCDLGETEQVGAGLYERRVIDVPGEDRMEVGERLEALDDVLASGLPLDDDVVGGVRLEDVVLAHLELA